MEDPPPKGFPSFDCENRYYRFKHIHSTSFVFLRFYYLDHILRQIHPESGKIAMLYRVSNIRHQAKIEA